MSTKEHSPLTVPSLSVTWLCADPLPKENICALCAFPDTVSTCVKARMLPNTTTTTALVHAICWRKKRIKKITDKQITKHTYRQIPTYGYLWKCVIFLYCAKLLSDRETNNYCRGTTHTTRRVDDSQQAPTPTPSPTHTHTGTNLTTTGDAYVVAMATSVINWCDIKAIYRDNFSDWICILVYGSLDWRHVDCFVSLHGWKRWRIPFVKQRNLSVNAPQWLLNGSVYVPYLS